MVEKEPKKGLFFRGLTHDLTQLCVRNGAYRVRDVCVDIGKDVGNVGNGVYTVVVARGVSLMPYTCD